MRLGRAFGNAWRYSFIVTLPVSILTLLWLPSSWISVRSFVIVRPLGDALLPLDTKRILDARIKTLWEEIRSATYMALTKDFERRPLPIYDIRIAPEFESELTSNLPTSGQKLVPAKFILPDEAERSVKVRLRGDSLHHWAFGPKSWRVRFPNKNLLEGQRRLDFVVPRRILTGSYYIPLRIAQELGVMVPAFQFVELRVNGRPIGGVHFQMEAVDESFLRRNGRLPGDIFLGDMVGKDTFPREQGDALSIWSLPAGWTKAAFNNKFEKRSTAPIRRFLMLLAASGTTEGHRDLMRFLDVDAWAKLAAWLQLTGSTHFDVGHNWVLYFDEGRQVLEPIVRDGNGLPGNVLEIAADVPGLNLGITSPILAQLHTDQEFLRKKMRIIAEFLKEKKYLSILAELDRTAARVATVLGRAHQLNWTTLPEWSRRQQEDIGIYYLGPTQFLQGISAHQANVREWFQAQYKMNSLDKGDVAVSLLSPNSVRILVGGRASLKSIRLPMSTITDSTKACLRFQIENEKAVCTPVDRYLEVSGDAMEFTLPLASGRRIIQKPADVEYPWGKVYRWEADVPVTYDLVVDGATFSSTGPIIAQGLMGERLELKKVADLKELNFPAGTRQVVPERSPVTYWSGEVNLSSNIQIEGDLVVGSGTKVMLAPEVTVTVNGRLSLNGEINAPIKFQRSNPQRPWGALVVKGPNADGSYLRHCDIGGGSGQAGEFHMYSGMLEIRDVKDLRVENCNLHDSSTFDDLVHLTYTTGHFRNVVIRNAPSDCIDIDISELSFENMTISGCGNDGMDLMTSRVVVKNSEITRTGDKGISVGEQSELFAENIRIEDASTGVQSKDGSKAYVKSSQLIGNKVQVSGYHKNHRYVGTVGVVFENNRLIPSNSIDLKDNSELYILGETEISSVASKRIVVNPPAGSKAAKDVRALIRDLSSLQDQKSRHLRSGYHAGH